MVFAVVLALGTNVTLSRLVTLVRVLNAPEELLVDMAVPP